MKILYFHVPKTAGSSLNNFFTDNMQPSQTHIENPNIELNKEFYKHNNFIAGHVSYTNMSNRIDLNDWITVATFREPVAHVISHLKWVRKLADDDQVDRFNAHPQIFQKIALKMKEFDFSIPEEISRFIKWLEEIQFYYFHNTQLLYINQTQNQKELSVHQINKALENLKNIDYVGIQEELNNFMDILSYEFGWSVKNKPRVNVNENNHGFDINNPETQKALSPLYTQDMILYEAAKDRFNKLKEEHGEIIPEMILDECIVGFIDSIKETKITGWVRLQNNLRKLTLELIIDDEKVLETEASLFRQGLKSKKIHPTGKCAFEFIGDFPIRTSQSIVVKIKDTNIAIKHL